MPLPQFPLPKTCCCLVPQISDLDRTSLLWLIPPGPGSGGSWTDLMSGHLREARAPVQGAEGTRVLGHRALPLQSPLLLCFLPPHQSRPCGPDPPLGPSPTLTIQQELSLHCGPQTHPWLPAACCLQDRVLAPWPAFLSPSLLSLVCFWET